MLAVVRDFFAGLRLSYNVPPGTGLAYSFYYSLLLAFSYQFYCCFGHCAHTIARNHRVFL